MAEKKNQHYVPQAYLRFFSNDDKNVGVYLMAKDKCIDSAPIKGQVSEDYFYSDDLRIENALDEIEGLGIRSFRMLLEHKYHIWEDVDYLNAYTFIMVQQGRTPIAANKMEAMCEDTCMQMFKIYSGLKEVDPHLKFKLGCAPAYSVGISTSCLTDCIDLHYRILYLGDRVRERFLTSDNPVCLVNPMFEMYGVKRAIALGNKGLCMLMPLSPEIAILLFDSEVYKIPNKDGWTEIRNDYDVEVINKVVASNAHKILLFNNKYGVSRRVKEYAHKLNDNDMHYFPTVNRSGCKLSFIRVVEKFVPHGKQDYSHSPQFVFRSFTCYLHDHPEEKQRLDSLWGAASEDDKRKFYEQRNNE